MYKDQQGAPLATVAHWPRLRVLPSPIADGSARGRNLLLLPPRNATCLVQLHLISQSESCGRTLLLSGQRSEIIPCALGLPWLAQMVQNLPAMQETAGLIPRSGRSPGGGNVLHTLVFLPGEFHGVANSQTQLSTYAISH